MLIHVAPIRGVGCWRLWTVGPETLVRSTQIGFYLTPHPPFRFMYLPFTEVPVGSSLISQRCQLTKGCLILHIACDWNKRMFVFSFIAEGKLRPQVGPCKFSPAVDRLWFLRAKWWQHHVYDTVMDIWMEHLFVIIQWHTNYLV